MATGNHSPDNGRLPPAANCELSSRNGKTLQSLKGINTDASISHHGTVKSPHKAGKSTKKKRSWKWPEGKPKRPLNVYNYFFQHERRNIIQLATSSMMKESESMSSNQQVYHKSSGVGFAGLARRVAAKWKTLDDSDKQVFEEMAASDKCRYLAEVEVWERSNKQQQSHHANSPVVLGGALPGSQGMSGMLALVAQSISQSLVLASKIQHEMLRQQFLDASRNNSVQAHYDSNYQPDNPNEFAVLFGDMHQKDERNNNELSAGQHLTANALNLTENNASNPCALYTPKTSHINCKSTGQNISFCDSSGGNAWNPDSIKGSDLRYVLLEDESIDISKVFDED